MSEIEDDSTSPQLLPPQPDLSDVDRVTQHGSFTGSPAGVPSRPTVTAASARWVARADQDFRCQTVSGIMRRELPKSCPEIRHPSP